MLDYSKIYLVLPHRMSYIITYIYYNLFSSIIFTHPHLYLFFYFAVRFYTTAPHCACSVPAWNQFQVDFLSASQIAFN